MIPLSTIYAHPELLFMGIEKLSVQQERMHTSHSCFNIIPLKLSNKFPPDCFIDIKYITDGTHSSNIQLWEHKLIYNAVGSHCRDNSEILYKLIINCLKASKCFSLSRSLPWLFINLHYTYTNCKYPVPWLWESKSNQILL